MAFKLADLFVSIGADRAPLNQELDKGKRDVTSWGGNLAKNLGGLIGGGLAIGFGTALAGVTALAAGALDFSGALNQQTDLIARSLGKTTEEAEAFEGVIKRVYSGRYGESVEQSSEAVLKVLQSLGDAANDLSEDELVKLTEAALGLARVFEVDVAESLRTADMLVKQGIAGSTEEALGIITAGFQNGLNVADDFLDTLNEYGDDFGRLGLDGAGALGLINRGLEAGILNADKIGDAINEFGINLKDPAVLDALSDMDSSIADIVNNFQGGYLSEGAAFSAILGQLAEIDDATLQNEIGVQLFRGVWEDFGAAGILALGNMNEGLIGHSDALTSLQPQYTSLTEFGGELWRRSLVALSPFSDKVLELVNERLPLIESGYQWLETEGVALLNDAAEGAAAFVDAWVNSDADNAVLRFRDALRETSPEAATFFDDFLRASVKVNQWYEQFLISQKLASAGFKFMADEFGLYFGLMGEGFAMIGEGIAGIYPNYIRPMISSAAGAVAGFMEQVSALLGVLSSIHGISLPSAVTTVIDNFGNAMGDLSEMTGGSGLAGLGQVNLPQAPTAVGGIGAGLGGVGAVTNNSNAFNVAGITINTQATSATEIANTISGALNSSLNSAGVMVK